MPRPHVNIKLAPHQHRPEKCSDVRAGRVVSRWVDLLKPHLEPIPTVAHLEALIRYHGGLKRSARILAKTSNPVHLDTLRNTLNGKYSSPNTLTRAVCMLRFLRSKELSKVPENLHQYATEGQAIKVRNLVLHLGSPGQASRYLYHIGVHVMASTLRKWALAGSASHYHRIQLVRVLAGLTYLVSRLGPQTKVVHTNFFSVRQPLFSKVHSNENTYMKMEVERRQHHLALINLASGKREEALKYPLSKSNIQRLEQDPLYLKLLPFAFPYPPDPSEVNDIVKKCGGARTVVVKLQELYGHNVRAETIRELTRKYRPNPVHKTLAYLRMLSAQHPNGIMKLPSALPILINTETHPTINLAYCLPLGEPFK